MRLSVFILSGLLAAPLAGADSNHEFNGHTKLRFIAQAFPDNSVFRNEYGSHAENLESDLRLNFSAARGRWSFDSAYQLFALHGDAIRWSGDGERLFNLSDVIHEDNRTIIAHRLDRLSLAYSSDKAVVRFGRQALSWGNGLFYTPMDLVNPFNPAAIDTEFKSGDDMLYAQYLRDSGDDVQGAVVFRRDPASGDVASAQATTALKYHGFAGEREYDVLVAENFGDTVVGIGGAASLGGAVLRADLVVTDTADDSDVRFVTNLSYAWLWRGRNVSGAAEYFYDAGENYLAGSVMVELSPLWTVTPTMLLNASDPSALFQLMTSHSLGDNLSFLGSLNVPIGASGTEFGGPKSGAPGQYLALDWGVFAQLAWYF
jgi:hypothetical protein